VIVVVPEPSPVVEPEPAVVEAPPSPATVLAVVSVVPGGSASLAHAAPDTRRAASRALVERRRRRCDRRAEGEPFIVAMATL